MKVPVKPMGEVINGPNVEPAFVNLFPRAEPLTFAYMRVAKTNPHSTTYRQMLEAQNPAQFFEDVPANFGERPQFKAMLAELRPKDRVVLIRLDHLAVRLGLRIGLLEQLVEARADIRLICNDATASTPTAALASEILTVFKGRLPPEFMDGGDGGCGNGGP